jgi:hypothetical protein
LSNKRRLDEIEVRLKAATPGVWKFGAFEGGSGCKFVFSKIQRDDEFVISKINGNEKLIADCQWGRDGDFIAHAPEDIAYLLDRVRKLEAFVSVADSVIDSASLRIDTNFHIRADQFGQLQRARAALEEK